MSCDDGQHAHELIARAFGEQRAAFFVAIDEEREGPIEGYCALGNTASMGRFFHLLGKIVRDLGRPKHCLICLAHYEAVLAAVELYEERVHEVKGHC